LYECKKALAFATVYLAPNGGKPPSGHTKIDYYNHLLDQMWLAEQKVPKEKTEEDGENECGENKKEKGGDVLDGERPQDYMFVGFVAFALFGAPTSQKGLSLTDFFICSTRAMTMWRAPTIPQMGAGTAVSLTGRFSV
jgi:hypothetical protein